MLMVVLPKKTFTDDLSPEVTYVMIISLISASSLYNKISSPRTFVVLNPVFS